MLIVDTAGRLQNQAELMGELEKMIRVMKKVEPAAPHAVLLVLDATIGQNALSQVEVFSKIAGVTGLVMTKLDGTARGGILVAHRREVRAAGAFHRRRRRRRRSGAVAGEGFRQGDRGDRVTPWTPARETCSKRRSCRHCCGWRPPTSRHVGAGVDRPDRDVFRRPARHRRAGRRRAGLSRLMLMQMMSAGAMGGGISSAIARALGAGARGCRRTGAARADDRRGLRADLHGRGACRRAVALSPRSAGRRVARCRADVFQRRVRRASCWSGSSTRSPTSSAAPATWRCRRW